VAALSELEVLVPRSLGEALEALSELKERAKVVAGGTDVIVRVREGKWRPRVLVDISRLGELRGIELKGGVIRIGALTTYAELVGSGVIRKHARPLFEACSVIGTAQVRNKGTIGGNLSTGSPAGDSIPPLYVLGAAVTLVSERGARELPVSELLLGPGETAVRPDELIAEVRFRAMDECEDGFFRKVGDRGTNFRAVASAAGWVRWGEGLRAIEDARIALGAVAPVVVFAKSAERLLRGAPLSEEAIGRASEAARLDLPPTGRAREAYKREVVPGLVLQGLYAVLERARLRGPASPPRGGG